MGNKLIAIAVPKFIMTLTLAIAISCCMGSAWAGSVTSIDKHEKNAKYQSLWIKAYRHWLDWVNGPYIDPDAPFANARMNIEKQRKKGVDPSAIFELCKTNAKEHPQDPVTVFSYYYAYLLYAKNIVAKTGKVPGQVHSDLTSLVYSVGYNRVHFPRAYNFVRIVFLCVTFDMPDRDFVPAGQNLLKRYSRDTQVLHSLARMLAGSEKPADQDLALKYAIENEKLSPDPSSVYLLADLYSLRWRRLKKPSDRIKAEAGFRQYISTAPSADKDFRGRAQLMLNDLVAGK